MTENRSLFKRLFGKKEPEKHTNAIWDAVSDTPPEPVDIPAFEPRDKDTGKKDAPEPPEPSHEMIDKGRAAEPSDRVYAPPVEASAEAPVKEPAVTQGKEVQQKAALLDPALLDPAPFDPAPFDPAPSPSSEKTEAGIDIDGSNVTTQDVADALGASPNEAVLKGGGVIKPLPNNMMPEPVIPLIKKGPAGTDEDLLREIGLERDHGPDLETSVEESIAEASLETGGSNLTGATQDNDNTHKVSEKVHTQTRSSEAEDNVTTDKDADPQYPGKPRGLFARLSAGLSRSSGKLSHGVTGIFTKRKLDDATLEDLEDLLISADLGVGVARRLTERLGKDKFDKEVTGDEIKMALAAEVEIALKPRARPLVDINSGAPIGRVGPIVILMAGVNGAGKTTTIAKLSKQFIDQGKSVMMVACDTFRAAAVEQLSVWAERVGAVIVKRELGADAAGLAYDALLKAREDNIDIVLVDTAGRLQNKTELMDELAKIIRVIKKIDDTAPHHRVLVLDATVGQNALSQTEVFHQVADITGLIMTKLDGTAKGGILVALADKFALPIHYIGVGEDVDDLQRFEAASFSKALTGL